AKFGSIVSCRRPGLLLRRGVIVGREVLNAVAKNFAQYQRIRRQERPQAELGVRNGHHRATFQLVLPSFVSSSSTPIDLSSSRMRSASLKFLAARAALRAAIELMTLASSTTDDAGWNLFHSDDGCCSNPISCALAFRQAAAGFAPFAASPRSSCSAAKALGVLRSSIRESSASAQRYPGAASAVSAYQ